MEVCSNHQLVVLCVFQEEELDELAGQVQLLESARLRLEMAMEQMRKENKKELAQREEEMEDTRCSAQKKVKGVCTHSLRVNRHDSLPLHNHFYLFC